MSKVELFQSTHPRRVWPVSFANLSGWNCFNPHTHAGCDERSYIIKPEGWVSIHTPTQGVTNSGYKSPINSSVSIHTPTQGVTSQYCWPSVANMFQSTHPRRVWPGLSFSDDGLVLFQSTHPRRVWQMMICRFENEICFNPHTHAGCDNFFAALLLCLYGFNPHTHAGCDFCHFIGCAITNGFNPHTHAGCDAYKDENGIVYGVSIHTPTQGVTCSRSVLLAYLLRFQSTHPRRVWLKSGSLSNDISPVSIHTPTQGVTTGALPFRYRNESFNPHTHAGCDFDNAFVAINVSRFQSTHPRRVWLYYTLLDMFAHGFQSTHPRRVWLFLRGYTYREISVSIHTPTQGVTRNWR